MPLNLQSGITSFSIRGTPRSPLEPRAPDCVSPTFFAPAKWRDVEFWIESSSDEFGRRGDIYEYPLSDDCGYFDLGRRARRFKIEGYLIGTDQVALTHRLVNAVEAGQPGELVHPLYGIMRVACITLTTAADYRKDKKRTKLSFEFVEANPEYQQFSGHGPEVSAFDAGSGPVDYLQNNTSWSPTSVDSDFVNNISQQLANMVRPGNDEGSWDAIDMLTGGQTQQQVPQPEYIDVLAPLAGRAIAATPTIYNYPTFVSATHPINFGSATVRRIHTDALERLRDFNKYVVNRSEQMGFSPGVQSLVITTRMIVIRDYALSMMTRDYETVKAAFDDLDFVMQVYDEEEAIATQRCDDVLVHLIRRARAVLAAAILQRNIRLPGIAEFPVHGNWPSLLVAHKLYTDGRRYEQVERYNATLSVWFMGRSVVAPAR